MFTKSRMVSLLAVLAFIFVLAGQAQLKADETVTCPVSGKQMIKAEAKVTWEYKGQTYYFCCEKSKAKFVADPESFLKKKVEALPAAKDVYLCPMCKDVKSDKPGKCPKCGMDLVKLEPGKDFVKKIVIKGPEGGMMGHGEGPGQMMWFEAPAAPGMMMHKGMMMHGAMKGRGMMGGCPMMNKDVDFKVDYTKDGVVVTLTSKDPDTVKIIQGHAAMMKKGCQDECQGECQDKAVKKVVVVKEETKKEPEKK